MLNDLLGLVRCPETGEPLIKCPPEWLAIVRTEQKAGRLFFQIGTQVEEALDDGLVNESRSYFIMLRDGAPELVRNRLIPIDHLELVQGETTSNPP